MKKIYFSTICSLFSILGFTQDGTLDTTFGSIYSTPGLYFKSINSYGETNNGIGNTISVNSSGAIIIGATEEKRASYSSPLEYGFGFHRGSGITDDNYSGVGIEKCNNSIILSNGKSILIGSKTIGSWNNSDDIQMQFNNADGSFDSNVSFTTGRRTINIGYSESITAIREYNNKLYACGYLKEASNSVLCPLIMRFDLLGNLDTTFGINGYIKQNINGYSTATDIFIQQDSKIIIVVPSDSGLGVKVIRYLSNGNLDNNFGTNGIVSLTSSTGYYKNKVIVQNDNKILVSGTLQINSPLSVQYTVSRLNENGSIDTAFGNNGIFKTIIGAGIGGSCTDMKILTNGKIILAGNLANDTGLGILRLNSNGVLDSTFGTNGITSTIMTNFNYTNISNNCIAISPNNNILVVGGAKSNFSSKNEIFIAQYKNSSILSSQDFSKSNIIIYPNPVKETIHLSNIAETDFEIYDILGNLVSKGKSENQINASFLTKGVYILKLKDGEKTINQKFIKE